MLRPSPGFVAKRLSCFRVEVNFHQLIISCSVVLFFNGAPLVLTITEPIGSELGFELKEVLALAIKLVAFRYWIWLMAFA